MDQIVMVVYIKTKQRNRKILRSFSFKCVGWLWRWVLPLVIRTGIAKYAWNMPSSPACVQHAIKVWFRSYTPPAE